MIRELTVNEVEDVSGGNNVAAAIAIGAGSVAVASVACTIARATPSPPAVVVCITATVIGGAAGAYVSGATAA